MRTVPDMHTVALAVAGGQSLLELAVAFDVFGIDRSALADPWYDFAVCAPAGARVGGWFQVSTPYGLDRLVTADTVIVPWSHDVEQPPPADLVDAVRAAHEAGARIASICTGAFVLAAAGLLDGRRATTHWMHAELLARRHPRVRVDPDVLYVDDGDVLTSAGKAAGLDLCLHLVRCDHGSAVANALARRLVVPPHREGGQAQFIQAPVPSRVDGGLGALLSWAVERLDEPLTVSDLARAARVSERTLTRQFRAATGTTPLRWLLTQRVHRAQELLETTDHSVEQVAARTGLGTAATLRRHFHRTLGVPPDAYRRAFHARSRAAA
ncbi:transcriptional regulator GlxA family with amidase domain [Pseudonocardia hierapolitana]|uniref:Transcriptional regulator GlxA family with amidase domain n=2 Tax=Pseudonocardia hierapolitana TaxID=1128676 RepID=A0A561SLY4_9PSEU|nr:transcriptional regulator GlxA family with amidase domain [Pseudonocardia hierapolitana]